MVLPALLFPASRTVSADFEARDQNVEVAVTFHLALHPIEQIALELLYFAAAQARHVHVSALRTPFVKVTFALHVQQVEFVDQSVALQQAQSAIDGNAIDVGIDAYRFAKYLRGVEMLGSGSIISRMTRR